MSGSALSTAYAVPVGGFWRINATGNSKSCSAARTDASCTPTTTISRSTPACCSESANRRTFGRFITGVAALLRTSL
jgi:hypothetical protein